MKSLKLYLTFLWKFTRQFIASNRKDPVVLIDVLMLGESKKRMLELRIQEEMLAAFAPEEKPNDFSN